VPKDWIGQDVFIIGGGTSLNGFNWDLLRNELTIGCNAAYKLGKDICKICIFGDLKFFKKYKDELQSFEGIVVTNETHLQNTKEPWLWTMRRESIGLHEHSLGWNCNTGASAINLAFILGAKRVYLPGFDMKLSTDGKSNWHNYGLDKPNTAICIRMNDSFKYVYRDWQKKFADREIINITNDSDLNYFPKIEVEKFWNERLLK